MPAVPSSSPASRVCWRTGLGGYIPAYLLFSAIIALTLLCIALAYRSGGATGEIEKENVLRAVFRSEDVF